MNILRRVAGSFFQQAAPSAPAPAGASDARGAVSPAVDLGLGLQPGDAHYRAFVGPPERYDLISAMAFSLLVSLGLRQHHRVLDIGCGSLRIGRLLIPYLLPEGYTGIEPEQWLINEGIAREVGRDLIRMRRPTLLVGRDASVLPAGASFDWALAQSIFSHTSLKQMEGWLSEVAPRLAPAGALVATYIVGDSDYTGEEWAYPGCVAFTPATVQQAAQRAGLRLIPIDWRHPHGQTWAIFAREAFDASWINQSPSWNRMIDAGRHLIGVPSASQPG